MEKSVHLLPFVNWNSIPYNDEVVKNMEFIKSVCSAISSIRKKNNLKARLPLQSVIIAGNGISISNELSSIISEETNVKEVIFSNDLQNFDTKTIINLDAKKIAKRIGADFQSVLKQAKEGVYVQTETGINIAGHNIFSDEYEINLKLNGEENNYASLAGKYLIILDIKITEELEMEGVARDFIRCVQNNRKEKNLNISDIITLKVHFKSQTLIQKALLLNKEFICSQVLAKNMEISSEAQGVEFDDDTTFQIT